jgi:hypothetical protein
MLTLHYFELKSDYIDSRKDTVSSDRILSLNPREKFEPGPGFEPRTSRCRFDFFS